MKQTKLGKITLLLLLTVLFAVMAVVPACRKPEPDSANTTEAVTTEVTTTVDTEETIETLETVDTEDTADTEETVDTENTADTEEEDTSLTETEAVTTLPETTKAPETTTIPETTTAPETDPPAESSDIPTDPAEIDELIASIKSGTAENEGKIDLAYLAYHQLSAGQKAEVKNYDALLGLMEELNKSYVVREYVDTRIPHHKFLLGTWLCQNVAPQLCLYDDLHIQEMVDCYIDYVVQPHVNEESLAQYYKYNIGMIPWTANLNIPNYHGGYRLEGENPAPEFDADAFRAGVTNLIDHPIIWGSFQCDEPNANDFEYFSKAGEIIENELLPDTANFYCLFPNMATQAQMGRPDYTKYVKDFVETIDTDTIFYDHYPYDNGDAGNLSAFLRNLNTVANHCYTLGRDQWIVLQVNTAEGRSFVVSADMMRFQAYASMAYGVKSITWGCWIEGWGHNNVYDENGVRTEQYEKLQETNADLKALEPIYMRYTGNSNAILCGVDGALDASRLLRKYIDSKGVEKMEHSALTELTPGASDFVLVGHYEKNVGEGEAYMFVNCNDIWFKEENVATVTFTAADPSALVTAYVKGIPSLLTPDENGVYTVEINGADAVFVTVG